MNLSRAQIVLLAAAMVACVALQIFVHWPRRVFGVQPDVLPLVMVYAGLLGEPLLVCLLALVGGLLLDAMSMNPLGTSLLSLLAVGLIAHAASEVLIRDQLYARCLAGAIASACAASLTLAVLLLTPERPALGWSAFHVVAGQAVWGALLAPVVFWSLERLDRLFNHPRLPAGSFRADREIKRGRN